MAPNERTFIQSVWDFFCSLKLTLTLLISLAITSIIGTVLPQGQIPPEYIAEISQTKFRIYSALGFFDMYHSWWFIALLCIFSINLICCSIKRLPHVFKFISQPMKVLPESNRSSFSLRAEIPFTSSPEQARDALKGFLGQEFGTPEVSEHNGEQHLFAQKSPWCRLGVYVVHTSILVIFVGAIMGSVLGYKAFVAIVEGTGVNSVQARSGEMVPLGFDVICEKFSVELYSNGAPKEYKSILTVMENGKPVPGYEKVKVIVNEPLTYKGITFYQSSYGQASEGSEHLFSAKPKSGGTAEQFALKDGDETTLKDGTRIKLIESTSEVRQFIPGMSGPATRVAYSAPGKEPQTFIVFKNYPDINAQRGDALLLTYDGSNARMYTGLQVAKDPGVWVVWLGCFLMVVGLYIAFFMSHRRIWIVVGKTHAWIYGNASKNQAAFQGQFEELETKLKNLKI